MSRNASLADVQEYYGEVLGGTEDLKTGACCSTEEMPAAHRRILGELPQEILGRFYGCGSPVPPLLEGARVLDLGCGAGRDAYLLARLVGPQGFVLGVDATARQLEVARRHLSAQMRRWGHAKPNLAFREGQIEDLRALDVADGSFDLVVSNCVINLSRDKHAVFQEAFRVLEPGGELLFSDIVADRRLPEELQDDMVLRGECLAGALYVEDLRRLLRRVGCLDHRVVSRRPVPVTDEALRARLGAARFESITVRAFKLDDLEDLCEDYGQFAVYDGKMPGAPDAFVLDDHHRFEARRPMAVCGNTAAMLSRTRYAPHFQVIGSRETHFGVFPCGPSPALPDANATAGACC